VTVARSASRVRKVCTGSGSPLAGLICLLVALRRAAADGLAWPRQSLGSHADFLDGFLHRLGRFVVQQWRDEHSQRCTLETRGRVRAACQIDRGVVAG
jgi:predicted component of type VI protein secretion system